MTCSPTRSPWWPQVTAPKRTGLPGKPVHSCPVGTEMRKLQIESPQGPANSAFTTHPGPNCLVGPDGTAASHRLLCALVFSGATLQRTCQFGLTSLALSCPLRLEAIILDSGPRMFSHLLTSSSDSDSSSSVTPYGNLLQATPRTRPGFHSVFFHNSLCVSFKVLTVWLLVNLFSLRVDSPRSRGPPGAG
ncbi:uncharacterized protein LOC120228212 isoform X2 [Hyaena hyaena]|uniref:uncharacterized protein LOC120228212 isoform X2 n=1 Tax=Hyaena hyaena TaxID=95912 RepID=UPI00192224EE|nr:uncharacterized protein LOC120228212 isoform X2 [Hyaena hyaena]XP_039082417.1 uncharacterized protein LOC120228212 isoform X2 [Hyaena hyaena]